MVLRWLWLSCEQDVNEGVAVVPQARKHVMAMPEYHPPLASRAMLRLDFNENTFAPSPRVMAKVQSLTAEGMTIYPRA